MSVLDDIIEGVLEDMTERQRHVPLSVIQEGVRSATPARDAFEALGSGTAEHGLSVIAEVKRSSPSRGSLSQINDPALLAASYANGGAAVISVLTEQRRFGGSLADFDAVRERVDIPLLRKDFIIDEYQIWEARAHGADLILLIVAALDDEQLTRFLRLTEELGMHALVEAHTEEEVHRAVQIGARIIGVNVRNLKTLDVDRSVFGTLSGFIPPGTVVVAESGVRDVQDVQEYAARGAHAVLVGEALVQHGDPGTEISHFTSAGTASMSAGRT
ncbi:indole-3-glycerol phosphate synthase TrpC [Arthrobacter roseus]|uniref:indole-3-glycerol phosphate synthase TrpC n=1 Tax=Arthrobacter roseus TaxID=136274 RepID=UPI00196604B5|nr:indole-3-glycerol phosphate synthase TrpC [Arthrobacter roseus]MBM7848429.1 indole-3-glycerol phosphate synthase [Arthrobacter roseus]